MFGFNSCNDDEDGDENDAGTIQATVSTGNVAVDAVKILWWDHYGYADEEVIASGEYNNGGFSINLPGTVPAKYLEGLFAGDEVPQGITVSNDKVKGFTVGELEAYKGDENVGEFWYGHESETTWNRLIFIYVDGDISINGTYSEEDGDDWTYTQTFKNLSLKKGWNKVYVTESKTNNVEVNVFTNSEPAGLKWVFESYGYVDEDPLRAYKSVDKHKAFSIFKH
jgi:hypothetical protein